MINTGVGESLVPCERFTVFTMFEESINQNTAVAVLYTEPLVTSEIKVSMHTGRYFEIHIQLLYTGQKFALCYLGDV